MRPNLNAAAQPDLRGTRVLFLTVRFPIRPGETFFGAELHALIDSGADVRVLPVRALRRRHNDHSALANRCIRPRLPRLREIGPIWSRRVRIAHTIAAIVRGNSGPVAAIRSAAAAMTGILVGIAAMRAQIDHIHAYWASTTADAACVAAAVAGVPWSLSCHRGDIGRSGAISFKLRTCVFARAISAAGARRLAALVAPGERGKIRIIHLGVNVPPQPFAKPLNPEPPLEFLCPARLVPVKGHRTLLRALALLPEQDRCSLRLLLAGSGPLHQSLGNLARELNVHETVQFLGDLRHSDLLDLYRRPSLAATILASAESPDGEFEGIPVSLMESMASGTPVIATLCGATGELIDSACAIPVAENDGAGLAQAMRAMLRSPQLRRQLGRAGRERVAEHFNSLNCAAEILRLIEAPAGVAPIEP